MLSVRNSSSFYCEGENIIGTETPCLPGQFCDKIGQKTSDGGTKCAKGTFYNRYGKTEAGPHGRYTLDDTTGLESADDCFKCSER